MGFLLLNSMNKKDVEKISTGLEKSFKSIRYTNFYKTIFPSYFEHAYILIFF